MLIKIIIILSLSTMLCGCGAGYMKIIRDSETGQVTEIQAKNFKGSVKKGDEEITGDSKTDLKLVTISANALKSD